MLCDISAPAGVSAPQVRVVLARNLEFTWQTPDVYTGPLTHYVMTAYHLDDAAVLPLISTVSSLFTSGQSETGLKIVRDASRPSPLLPSPPLFSPSPRLPSPSLPSPFP